MPTVGSPWSEITLFFIFIINISDNYFANTPSPLITETIYLFLVTGYLYVAADLSMEYSYVFRGIEICIADRRDSWICRDLTIVMSKYFLYCDLSASFNLRSKI